MLRGQYYSGLNHCLERQYPISECWLKPQLLCFRFKFLLIHWGKQWIIFQVLGSLPLMGEIYTACMSQPGLALVATVIWGINQWMEVLFVSISPFLCVPLSFK